MYLLWCPKFTSNILASDWFVQSHVSQKKEVLLWSWSVVKKKKNNAAKGNYPPLSCFSLSVRLLKLPYTELSRYISIEYWIIHILCWKKVRKLRTLCLTGSQSSCSSLFNDIFTYQAALLMARCSTSQLVGEEVNDKV